MARNRTRKGLLHGVVVVMRDWAKYGVGPLPAPTPRRLPPPRLVEPPVTIAEMTATYRRVLPQCSPLFAAVLRDIMVRCVAGGREPGEDDDVA